MNARLRLLLVLVTATVLPTLVFAADAPSRKAAKGCAWEKFSDGKAGLAGWVQRCDFGSRKIDLFMKGKSLFLRYSDGGEPEPLIDVIDLHAGESAEAGLKRIFAERTDKKVAGRCVLAPFTDTKGRSEAKRYTFVPDAKYKKELDAVADPGDIPEPPCGDYGEQPDGIAYFEVQPANNASRILFVRVGQDEPLFDEQTLRLITSTPLH